jgi:hypothetical protein
MITCPKCGFKDHIEGAVFCQNCGQHIGFNYCTNPECPESGRGKLPDDARYCPFCGKKTYFSEIGIFPTEESYPFPL